MPRLSGWFGIALARLDLILHREILRLRARYELSLDEFRGLYVSDEQVDALVGRGQYGEADASVVAALTARAEALRASAESLLLPEHRWATLQSRFGLDAVEQDVLLLAAAPELDRKYEALCAYLNNDVTRKLPTLDLALRVLADEEQGAHAVRAALLPESRLTAAGLIQMSAGSAFAPAPGLVPWMLGLPFQDARLAGIAQRCEETPLVTSAAGVRSDALADTLDAAAQLWRCSEGERPLFVFTGRPGAGRRTGAARLAAALGKPVVRVDLDAARTAEPAVLRTTLLLQRLEGALLCAEHADTLIDAEGRVRPEACALLQPLRDAIEPVVLVLPVMAEWRELLGGARVVHISFAEPTRAERIALWTRALGETDAVPADAAVEALATRFTLTPGQIRAAARAAADVRTLDGAGDEARSDVRDDTARLFAAARMQSSYALARLAQKVELVHDWNDLVLSDSGRLRLQEITAAVRQRERVYEEWGFGRRLGSGRGIKVLFAGASGTGKTMAASVMARDLALDLYRIDLSGVVSKYIGETEKNLDRIFRAAASSNAILFFDEADALFGKRSEVKDAHDRYANIEVAYLLQKVEEHSGAVILATNLARNIDEAFSRRMHYVVEFALPDERQRERLWRGMFPREAPLAPDIDFDFLAKQFRIAGGDIRNVALDAAFLAAQNGGVVGMRQVVRAMVRQLAKQGKVPSPTEFKQYYGLCG